MPQRELDLGAGRTHRAPNAIRADSSREVKPHVVLDATQPFPLQAETFDRVYCFDVLEHVPNVSSVMEEIHRILTPSGTCFVTTPHFSSANSFTDPTHTQHFGWHSFDYFSGDHVLGYYSQARFEITHRVLRFHGGVIDAVVRRLANRWPDWYERRLTWIRPAWYLEFELTKVA